MHLFITRNRTITVVYKPQYNYMTELIFKPNSTISKNSIL